MSIIIEKVLDEYSLEAIYELMQDDFRFEDGKKTAGIAARKVKLNEQSVSSDTMVAGALKKIEEALASHPLFQQAALPARFSKIMLSRYHTGMHYGKHVDDAFIANTRTDLSFTLFLSEPESYTGGELIVHKHDGDDAIKLAKGDLYLYPANQLHQVRPVDDGVRLAAVGWVQSRIRSHEQRNILFNLANVLSSLKDKAEEQETHLTLLQSYNSLLRLWAD